jgi:hypothetical protein
MSFLDQIWIELHKAERGRQVSGERIFCISWLPLLDQDQKGGGLFKSPRSRDPVRHACINVGRGTLIRIRTGAGAVRAMATEVRNG